MEMEFATDQLKIVRGIISHWFVKLSSAYDESFDCWRLQKKKVYGRTVILFSIKPEQASQIGIPLKIEGATPWDVHREINSHLRTLLYP